MHAHPSRTEPPATPDDAFFRALEARRVQALLACDLPQLEALHAADYQLVTPAGRSFGRERYLAVLGSGELRYLRWEIGELRVRATPWMALLRYEATLELARGGGRGTAFRCWHTDSYERVGERWQAVWSQATAIRPPDGP